MMRTSLKNSVTLRQYKPADESFLFRLFCSANAQQFASLDLPFAQSQQWLRMQFDARDSQYRAQYANADFDLVLHNAQPIGNFFSQRGPEEFVLIDVTLLPEYRKQGIATKLVTAVIDAAGKAHKPLHAHVLSNSPAWVLWQRLGFREVRDDGVYRHIEVPFEPAGTR